MKIKAKGTNRELTDVAHPTNPGEHVKLILNQEFDIPDDRVCHSKELVDKVNAGEIEIIPETTGVTSPPLGGTPVGDGSVNLPPFNQYSAVEGNFYFNCRTINYDPAVVAHVHKYDIAPIATTDPTKFILPGADQYIYNTLVVYGLAGTIGWRFRRVVGPITNAGELVQLDCRTFQLGPIPGGVIMPVVAQLRCDYHMLILSGRLY